MKAISGKQKRRLRWVLILFFIFLSLPVYYLLQTVYSQLEKEAYFTARHQAEKFVDQLERKLQQILKTEQNRSIAEYSFYNVMENPLLSEIAGIKFSPLSEIPPKTDVKGLIGYFQINTDGSFHLPALPELGQDNISGLSLAELENRLALKRQLRNLLSIKIAEKTEKRLAVKEDLNLSAKIKNKAKSETTIQPYIEEFEQQKLTVAAELASPALALKEKKQSTVQKSKASTQSIGRLQKQAIKTSTKFRTRQEIVQLPDQMMANSYFKQSKDKTFYDRSREKNNDEQIKSQIVGTNRLSDSAINILSIVSEVTPLQLLFIGQKYFCFYRYVWHDNQRYTQGFIVKKHKFLTALSQPILNANGFSSLVFVQGDLQEKINISDLDQEYQLYNRYLSMPFQKLELIINAAKLSKVPGSLIIDLLALLIFIIFLITFVVFYRLGCRQIDLAKQQQNFISAVSHELKTPLTSIRMYGEMLRSGWVTDETKKQNYYDFIFFESERLSRLIANVLQLARLGHQKQKSEIITTTAKNLLDRISAKVGAQIEASSFQLNILAPLNTEESLAINVDEDAFFQIIINLVDNAIKFTNNADNKQIDIGFKASKNSKQVAFFIRDYGPGIQGNQIKKIFQLFYRSGDELTRTTPGTGIGLALVAQLAETMKAHVDVINKQPGAEFQIKLQIVRED